jgi:hypothetical protein
MVLRDCEGRNIGGVNVLVDITAHQPGVQREWQEKEKTK